MQVSECIYNGQVDRFVANLVELYLVVLSPLGSGDPETDIIIY